MSGALWRNWGRTESVRPLRVERPSSPEAVQRAVQAALRASLTIKAVGAGHSFSGIALARGVQLDLHALSGLVGVDAALKRVTLLAGTRLYDIPSLLTPYGLAMPNLGDIDRQTISGAISTGTHGTGAAFTGISGQVRGVAMVVGDGSILRVSESENSELLPAVALGLGALGILVEVTLQCVEAFVLHAVERSVPLADLIPDHEAFGSDHFEFYWFPHTTTAVTKINTRHPATRPLEPLSATKRWVDDALLANGVYGLTCAVGAVLPVVVPLVNGVAERVMGNREFTDHSHRVFTSKRTVRFRELEYAIPVEAVTQAFDEVRRLVERSDWRISFPIEVRFSAPDDLWLSTASNRKTAYIAVHRYVREDPTVYFAAVEQIMLAHGGRPHWGKMHTRTSENLREVYPHFDDFIAVRDRLDPGRVFTNNYLKRVLGE